MGYLPIIPRAARQAFEGFIASELGVSVNDTRIKSPMTGETSAEADYYTPAAYALMSSSTAAVVPINLDYYPLLYVPQVVGHRNTAAAIGAATAVAVVVPHSLLRVCTSSTSQ